MIRNPNAKGCLWPLQGLGVAGGGERNGMEGIVVGIDGKLGSGGSATLGTLDGIMGKLGSGGSVGLGRVVGWAVGRVGRVG